MMDACSARRAGCRAGCRRKARTSAQSWERSHELTRPGVRSAVAARLRRLSDHSDLVCAAAGARPGVRGEHRALRLRFRAQHLYPPLARAQVRTRPPLSNAGRRPMDRLRRLRRSLLETAMGRERQRDLKAWAARWFAVDETVLARAARNIAGQNGKIKV